MPDETPSVSVRRVSAAAVRPLRADLLRPGTPPDDLVYGGDLDPDALHLGAFAGDEQIGIATVVSQPPNISVGVPAVHPNPDEMRAWRLRGMAVVEAWRGQKVGAALLGACIGYVAERGGVFLWCDARTPARDFYARYGFSVMGDEFHKPNAGPHYYMQREITPGDIALLDVYLEDTS